MGQNTYPFGQKKPPRFIHKSCGCILFFIVSLSGLVLLLVVLEWHTQSVHDGNSKLLVSPSSRVCGCRMGDTPGSLALAPTKELMQCSGFNGSSLFSLLSCFYSWVLDIFQINIKRCFEKQTLSAPSKGKGNMHLNENPVFY